MIAGFVAVLVLSSGVELRLPMRSFPECRAFADAITLTQGMSIHCFDGSQMFIATPSPPTPDQRIDALEARVAALEKRPQPGLGILAPPNYRDPMPDGGTVMGDGVYRWPK